MMRFDVSCCALAGATLGQGWQQQSVAADGLVAIAVEFIAGGLRGLFPAPG